MPVINDLDAINSRADLDFFTVYNNLYVDEVVNDDPYFGVKLSSKYHSIESLSSLCNNQKSAVYLSLNVQSLLSKHEQLSIEISELELKNVTIDAIAVQETYDVKYTDLVPLNGFNPLVCKRRRDMRGGGVGFYIRNGLTVEIIENLSPFENKIIEALTIKLTYPDSKVTYLTSIYRSNGTLANVTPAQQWDRFMEKFATLLTDLQALNKVSFVFLDANFNLLRLQLPDPSLYFNCILEKGFLQIISKATRMQNESNTLIDHVLTNSKGLDICSGTLISDVSDHFFTFVLPRTGQTNKQNHRTLLTRDFSNQNMLEFRTALGDTDWTNVSNKLTVDEAYEEFWNIYKETYNTKFPLKRVKLNKNIHKIQNFMTKGLMVSRNRKKFFIEPQYLILLLKTSKNTKIIKLCIKGLFVGRKNFSSLQNFGIMLGIPKRHGKHSMKSWVRAETQSLSNRLILMVYRLPSLLILLIILIPSLLLLDNKSRITSLLLKKILKNS
jgi:hypothetical protein